MKRLAVCLWMVVAYSALAGKVPAIFLTCARNTGDLAFYLLWFAAVAVFALLGGMGCASVYQETDDAEC